jgi:hypothetical protein
VAKLYVQAPQKQAQNPHTNCQPSIRCTQLMRKHATCNMRPASISAGAIRAPLSPACHAAVLPSLMYVLFVPCCATLCMQGMEHQTKWQLLCSSGDSTSLRCEQSNIRVQASTAGIKARHHVTCTAWQAKPQYALLDNTSASMCT